MRKIFAALSVLLLAACTGTVEVPPVALDPLVGKPLSGKYAALVQSGGWAIKANNTGFQCSAWDFKADLNTAYSDAMQNTLRQALEKVEFIPSPLNSQQIRDGGYDAQIVFYQGGVTANYGVSPGFFVATINSQVKLDSTLAINDSNGLVYQNTITASGSGNSETAICSQAGDAVKAASQAVIKELAQKSVLFIRDALREQKEKQAAAKPAS